MQTVSTEKKKLSWIPNGLCAQDLTVSFGIFIDESHQMIGSRQIQITEIILHLQAFYFQTKIRPEQINVFRWTKKKCKSKL